MMKFPFDVPEHSHSAAIDEAVQHLACLPHDALQLSRILEFADEHLGAYFAAYQQYLRSQSINLATHSSQVGFSGVLPVIDCGNRRFELPKEEDESCLAFVCEAIDSNGYRGIDFVAWPLDRPSHVMTLGGRVGLLGAWQAHGSAAYLFNYPLQIYRTPLEWLQNDCDGAVIIDEARASHEILCLPGKVAAQDMRHGARLSKMMRKHLLDDRIVVPAPHRYEVAA